MIRTVLRITGSNLTQGEGAPPLQHMHGTISHLGYVLIDHLGDPPAGHIVAQWRWPGYGPLIELVALDQATLLAHLPPTHDYDDEGNITATHPPVLHMPVEIAGWPAWDSAVPEPMEPLRAAARARINASYNEATDALAAGYPYRERESWHVQVSEAQALLADGDAETPWIDAAAAQRGIERVDLAQRIQTNDQQYRLIHGTLSGIRQGLEDAITAASTANEINAINWPRAEETQHG